MTGKTTSIIRKLPFEVGDGVRVINGTVGKIERFGSWRINGRLFSVVYKVNGRYWSDWQLHKIVKRRRRLAGERP